MTASKSDGAARLDVRLTLPRREVISGESLALKVELVNPGDQPTEIVMAPVSPVSYRLLAANDAVAR